MGNAHDMHLSARWRTEKAKTVMFAGQRPANGGAVWRAGVVAADLVVDLES